jgi:uncharacterized protein (DUF2461 family)
MGDSLTRVPRGYPPDHPLADDLKRRSFAIGRPLDQAQLCNPRAVRTVTNGFADMRGVMDYLCAALDLGF